MVLVSKVLTLSQKLRPSFGNHDRSFQFWNNQAKSNGILEKCNKQIYKFFKEANSPYFTTFNFLRV